MRHPQPSHRQSDLFALKAPRVPMAARGDSMTRSILKIVLSPASSSGGGIPPSRLYERLRKRWRRCFDSGRRP